MIVTVPMSVLDDDLSRGSAAPEVVDQPDRELPAALEPGFIGEARERIKDVEPEEHQGETDEPGHERIHARRYLSPHKDRRDPEDEDDRGMTTRVDRCEDERSVTIRLGGHDVTDRRDVVDVQAMP